MEGQRNCPNCGYANPPNFKFCGECGTKLKNLCPNCGFENPLNFKFCGECGTNLLTSSAKGARDEMKEKLEQTEKPQPPPREIKEKELEQTSKQELKKQAQIHSPPEEKPKLESEKRPISILFADISGFTSLSEKLDPEELRAFIGEVLNNLAKIVRKNGGYVDKFIGDEIMALFGAPRAHGDDTKRAVQTAIEMDEFIRQNYSDISIHGGIATGEVVVGSISDNPRDYTAMGDTVNIAKRLEEESQSWQFLVDENTYLLTSHIFDFLPWGDVKLKGKEKPVRIFQVKGKKYTKVLIGRDEEIKQVKEIILRPHPNFIAVVGDHGMGVSSFIEFISQEINGVIKVTTGSKNEPYGTIKKLFPVSLTSPERDIINLSEKLEISYHILGYIFGIIFPNSPLKYIPPDMLEKKIEDAIYETLLKMYHDKIIVIDDFDNIDSYSQKIFIGLPSMNPNFSVIVGLSYTGVDMRKFSDWEVIRLGSFDLEKTKGFINYILGNGTEIEQKTLEFIWEKTEGNPFFIFEFVNLLREKGAIAIENGKVKIKDTSAVPKVIGARQIVLSIIDSLPELSKYILQVISCLETPYKEILYRFFEKEKIEFGRILKDLEERNIISDSGEIINFKQKIFKEVLYDTLLKTKKVEMHSKLYESAVEISGDNVQLLSSAAFHAEMAERFSSAFEAYSKAAGVAKSKLNIPLSKTLFEKALQNLSRTKIEEIDHQKLYKIFMDYGELLYSMGEISNARDIFSKAINYSGEKIDLIMAQRWVGDCEQILGNFSEAQKIYEQIIKETINEDNIQFRAELTKALTLMCHLFVEEGKPKDGIKFGEKALGLMSDELKKIYPEIYADAANAIGRCYFSLGDYHKAKTFFSKFYEITQKINNPRLRGIAISNYAAALYATGELEISLTYTKEYLEIARAISDTRGEAIAMINMSQILFEIGKFSKSQEMARSAIEIFSKIGDKYSLIESLGTYSLINILIGDYEPALEALDELIKENLTESKLARCNLLYALAHLGRKNYEKAREYLNKAELSKEDFEYKIAQSQLFLAEGAIDEAKKMGEIALIQAKRDIEKIIAILNLLKIKSNIKIDFLMHKEEKENLERELKNIIVKYPSFNTKSLKFFS